MNHNVPELIMMITVLAICAGCNDPGANVKAPPNAKAPPPNIEGSWRITSKHFGRFDSVTAGIGDFKGECAIDESTLRIQWEVTNDPDADDVEWDQTFYYRVGAQRGDYWEIDLVFVHIDISTRFGPALRGLIELSEDRMTLYFPRKTSADRPEAIPAFAMNPYWRYGMKKVERSP